MKLKTFKKYKNKTLQLNISKLKLYKKKQPNNFQLNSKKLESNLKKILHVIYQYHKHKKKILFLEFPISFKHILKKTKHILTPANIFNNIITDNTTSSFTDYNKIAQNKRIPLKNIKNLLKLNRKIDLVVASTTSNISTTLINKNYKLKTPVIYCFNQLDRLNTKITYKIAATNESLNEKIISSNFIFTMIKTTLEKSISKKKNKI